MHPGLLAIGLIIALAIASYFIYSYSGGGSAPQSTQNDSEKSAPFATIRKSDQSAQKLPATYTIYGEDQLRPIWEGAFSDETIPDVDFSKYMVVAAFLGARSTSGYSITITGVKETDSEILVTIQTTIPGPSCNPESAKSSPVHIVRLPKSDKTVTFISATQVTSCR